MASADPVANMAEIVLFIFFQIRIRLRWAFSLNIFPSLFFRYSGDWFVACGLRIVVNVVFGSEAIRVFGNQMFVVVIQL